ncbi:hypothetical protein CBR64_20455 [Cellulosimicrobium cellulans]|uniref:Uncharacterized protein n=1 Tax=Cellulosimicrobium cellulans TaxID=1710 RepID=A0A1Y0HZM5_CELCE|nr:hypothetical protein [Cellulosimicrobium cellulans]ARU53449.1 hypothetical protein CBR64_20455 [Cellulosimicrobium cellulans]
MIVVSGCEPLSIEDAVKVCELLNALERESDRARARGARVADSVLGLRGGASDMLSRGTVQRRGVNLTASTYTREISRGADRGFVTTDEKTPRVLLDEIARLLNVAPPVAVGKARRVRKIAIKRLLNVRRT